MPGYTLGQATAGANALPALRELPPGVHNAAYGDAEAMSELFSGFAGAMVAGVLLIARRFGLTSYDAAYLELAQRRSFPLATLDEKLRQACKALKVSVLP